MPGKERKELSGEDEDASMLVGPWRQQAKHSGGKAALADYLPLAGWPLGPLQITSASWSLHVRAEVCGQETPL